MERLPEALNLKSIVLPHDDYTQLFSLVTEFAHLFALDNDKLGQNSLVTHRIDTGDHLPIKQPP